MLFVISGFFNTNYKMPESGFINAFIIILPAIFIFCTGDNTLGTYALSKRTLISPSISTNDKQGMPKDTLPLEITVKDSENTLNISMHKLIIQWDKYDEKQVSIQGLFSKDIKGYDNYSLVFKYMITCCAADAQPIGIFVEKKIIGEFKNNDWVEVSGKVTLQKFNGFSIIIMQSNKIEKIPQPSKGSAYIFF